MKKILLGAMLMVTAMLSSCSFFTKSGSDTVIAAVDSNEVVDSVAVDSVTIDSIAPVVAE